MNKLKKLTVASPYFLIQISVISVEDKRNFKRKLSTGPYTNKFEKKICSIVVAICGFLNTCTSALEISIQSLNLKK